MSQTLINAVVISREDHTDDVAVFELASENGDALLPFEAGAHIDLEIESGLIRQYSLSNNPDNSNQYRLGILKDPQSRGGSQKVHELLKVGSAVRISEPRNHFPLNMEAEHSVLIGGGIGVTPMIAMAYALKAAGRSFEFHYCCRCREKAGFMDELQRVFADELTLHFDDEGEANRLNPKTIVEPLSATKHVYVCGPGGFMDWVIAEVKANGLAEEQVHFEYFNAEVDIEGETFEVQIKGQEAVIQVQAHESIANALKAAGIKVDVSCEQGVCGTCICDVIEGTPDHRDHFLTDEEKEDNDQIALCCSRAKSPRLVIDL
ncbi:oxidoreductase [Amphritea opalescens]|uniref:Oxidoreductase n=1 Tax=Amphritea opalescens TaxID=2490544 RepID=A0A430KM01_9GAMM|nr:PDR/VanB family oxidoreductase [Amphritea opalescens]RTE64498.1 oxidoreductase [Amphritea opalescens]